MQASQIDPERAQREDAEHEDPRSPGADQTAHDRMDEEERRQPQEQGGPARRGQKQKKKI